MKLTAQIVVAFFATFQIAFADHELIGRDIPMGKDLYQAHCANCHGTNLEGQPNWRSPDEDGVLPAPPHDRTGHTWHHDNVLLFEYTKFGGKKALELRGYPNFISGMQGFADTLSDVQIWSVLAFIQSTWPEKEQTIQSAKNPVH